VYCTIVEFPMIFGRTLKKRERERACSYNIW
jgi:hypothetical protein